MLRRTGQMITTPKDRSPRFALSPPQIGYWRWASIFGGFVVIWLFVVLMSSWNKSPVVDEVPHIGAGLTYLTYGDFRMNPEHPPLIKMLSAIPVILIDRVPVIFKGADFYVAPWYESWQDLYGFYVLFRNKINVRMVMFHARLVPVTIAMLGGMLAFWWGRRLSSRMFGGAAAGILLLLYPEYAGHGRFVTLDVPTLVACGALAVAGYRWWLTQGRRETGVFIAAAVVGSLVKLPVSIYCVFLLATLGIMIFFAPHRLKFRRYAILVAGTFLACYFAAWASSGFRFALVRADLPITGRSVYAPGDGNYGKGLFADALGFAWRHRLLPETSLSTLKHVQSFGGRNYYFWGKWSREGWYSYYFGTFLLKTSLVMTAVYFAALMTWAWQLLKMKGVRKRFEAGRLTILLLPFLMLFALFVAGRTNLGHRYILFMYLPLSILTGSAMARWWIRSRMGSALCAVVLLYALVAFVRQYPHYETYFNEVVRTPFNGSKYLADSNIDWGQDFPLLGDELRERRIVQFNMALFGASNPGTYGIGQYRWILPSYPFAIFHQDGAVLPDPSLPTALSLNTYLAAKLMYPRLYGGKPMWAESSMVIFPPVQ